jgi:hypothetical protein
MDNDLSTENIPEIIEAKQTLFKYYDYLKSLLKNSNKHFPQLTEPFLTDESITNTSLTTILHYIKELTSSLINPSYLNNHPLSSNSNNISSYESLLKKYENDIRSYSKLIFQYRAQCESLEMKIESLLEIEEEFEEMKEKYKYEEGTFLNNDKKDNEIFILRSENSKLKKVIDQLESDIKQLKNENKNSQTIITSLQNKLSSSANNSMNLNINAHISKGNKTLTSSPQSMKLYMRHNATYEHRKENNYLPSSSAYNSPCGKSTNELSSSTSNYNNTKVKSSIQSAKKMNNMKDNVTNYKTKKKDHHHHKTKSMNMSDNVRSEVVSKYISNYQYYNGNSNSIGKDLQRNYYKNNRYLHNGGSHNSGDFIKISKSKGSGNLNYLNGIQNKNCNCSSNNVKENSINKMNAFNVKNNKPANKTIVSVRSVSRMDQQ